MPQSNSSASFVDLIASLAGKRVLHMGHSDADCDALGSAYALSCILPGELYFAKGLKVSAQDLADWLGIQPLTEVDPADFDYTIIYDTISVDLLGMTPPAHYALIDHHSPGGHRFADFHNELAEDAEWCWLRPREATCSVLVELFQYNGIPLTKKMAVALAAGIVTDTAWLQVADAGALRRLSWVLDAADLYLEDVYEAIDSRERRARRRRAVLAALDTVEETWFDGLAVVSARTTSHENGFAVSSALAHLGADIRVVAFPRRDESMVMIECDGYLVERRGIDMLAVAGELAQEVGASDQWGTLMFGRVVAPASEETLIERAVELIGQALIPTTLS